MLDDAAAQASTAGASPSQFFAQPFAMIQVQIASDITAAGVSGVRWVLVEPALQASPEVPPPATTLAAAADVAPAPSEGDWLRLSLFKLLLVAAGLGVALWLASQQLGPPALPALRGDGGAKPALPARPAPPAASAAIRSATTATAVATSAAPAMTAGLQ